MHGVWNLIILIIYLIILINDLNYLIYCLFILIYFQSGFDSFLIYIYFDLLLAFSKIIK